MNIVALIPARAGSKRIPGKNIKLLGGKPLLEWTIRAADAAGIFREIIVSTDSPHTFSYVRENFNVRASMRPWPTTDDEPDIQWVQHTLCMYRDDDLPDAFAILRPTSPFRTADTINRAVKQFHEKPCSSLRAVEPVKQHPGKMWQAGLLGMTPLIPGAWTYESGVKLEANRIPWHSQPTQSLPKVYIQNSSLEMAWTWCVTVFDSISGPKVAPFFTEGMEGFSIDYPEDWDRAERYVADLQAHPAAQ